jgi:hypothetical protein
MRLSVRPIVLALCATTLIAIGCVGRSPFGPDERRELAEAERRWSQLGFSDYSFEFRMGCFCGPSETEWSVVEVRAGEIIAVRRLTGEDIPPSEWGTRLTVDQLFERARTYRPEWLEDVAAAFHPDWGYPVEISFTSKPQIADAGLTYYARNVQPME